MAVMRSLTLVKVPRRMAWRVMMPKNWGCSSWSRCRAADADSDLGTTVSRTVATAGRTISFSAMIVIASLAGLFAFSDPTFTSLAIGGIATVLVALGAGLTLVPALLGSWGHKIKPVERQAADHGFFGMLARRVQRHPII